MVEIFEDVRDGPDAEPVATIRLGGNPRGVIVTLTNPGIDVTFSPSVGIASVEVA